MRINKELQAIIANISAMTPRKLNNYIRKLEYIDEGSSRAAYKINRNYVIKQAYNQAGKMQNLVEVDAYKNLKHKGLMNPVYAGDPNGNWIIVDRCFDNLNEIIEEKTGMTYTKFQGFINICEEVFVEGEGFSETFKMMNPELYSNKFVKQVEKFLLNNSGITDFHAGNFGYNIRLHKMVLLDYGYSEEVRNEYYM